MTSVKNQVAKGAAWTTSIKLTLNVIAILSQLVLARILVPEDFGLVAVAGSIVALLEVMSQFGFNIALIQNRQADRSHYDSAWTLTFLTAVVTGLALVVLAKPTAAFYSDPRIESIVYLFAVFTVIKGATNIGIVAFQRDLEFHKEFAYLVIQKLVGLATTIGLAIYLKSYWALAVGICAVWFTGFVLSYVIHPYRPRLDLSRARELFSFSQWVLFNNILGWAGGSGISAIIGRIVGVAPAGLYGMANQLSIFVTREVGSSVNRAVFPGMAKISDDHERLRNAFISTVGVVVLVVSPMAFGLASIADPLIPALLGEKWDGVAGILAVLCVTGLLVTMQINASSVILALGEPRRLMVGLLVRIAFIVFVFMPLLTQFRLEQAALSLIAAETAVLATYLNVLRNAIGLNPWAFVKTVARPVAASVTMAAVVLAAKSLLLQHMTPLSGLAVCAVIGALTYVVTALALWRLAGGGYGAESQFIGLLQKATERFHRQKRGSGILPRRRP